MHSDWNRFHPVYMCWDQYTCKNQIWQAHRSTIDINLFFTDVTCNSTVQFCEEAATHSWYGRYLLARQPPYLTHVPCKLISIVEYKRNHEFKLLILRRIKFFTCNLTHSKSKMLNLNSLEAIRFFDNWHFIVMRKQTRIHRDEDTTRPFEFYLAALKDESLKIVWQCRHYGKNLLCHDWQYFYVDAVELVKTTPSSSLNKVSKWYHVKY